jgi:hypothetical protein
MLDASHQTVTLLEMTALWEDFRSLVEGAISSLPAHL